MASEGGSYPPDSVPSQEPAASGMGTNGKAIASLVLGILGMLVLPIVFSTLAIIFAIIARKEIRERPGLGGDGMAIAGLVLGVIGIIGGIVLIAVLVS